VHSFFAWPEIRLPLQTVRKVRCPVSCALRKFSEKPFLYLLATTGKPCQMEKGQQNKALGGGQRPVPVTGQ